MYLPLKVACVAVLLFSSSVAWSADKSSPSALTSIGNGESASRGVDCASGDVHDDGTGESGFGWDLTVTQGIDVERFTPGSYPHWYTKVCICWQGNDDDIDFDIVFFDDDGPGGEPGTLLKAVPATALAVPTNPGMFYTYNVNGPVISSDSVYVGARWNGSLSHFLCDDESVTTPQQTGYASNDGGANWFLVESIANSYQAFLIRTDGELADDCNGNHVADALELAGDPVFAQETILDDNGIGPGLLLAIGSSCPFNNSAAEDFTLPAHTEIARVGWRGLYFGAASDFPGVDSNFHITFYEDNGTGNIGGVIADFPSVVVTKTLHPRPPVFGTNPVYSYETTLPTPVKVEGGQRYWISINGDPAGPGGPVFGWMASSTGNAASIAGNDQPLQTTSITCATLPALAYTPGGDLGDQDADSSLLLYSTESSNDCNGNGVLDECDITDATSEDCNSNGIPDECDVAGDLVSGDALSCEGAIAIGAVPTVISVNLTPDGSIPFDVHFCGSCFSVYGGWASYRPAWSVTAFIGILIQSTPFMISVFDGCPELGGMQIACNLPNPNGVVFDVERGHTYYIRFGAIGVIGGNVSGQMIGPDVLGSPNDYDGNGVPDECDCLFDVNNDGTVDFLDYVAALMNAGQCMAVPCTGDVDGSGTVDVDDYMLILNNMGPCLIPVRASLDATIPRTPQK